MDLRIPRSRMERNARLLLRAYPAEYRAERGGEILDTLGIGALVRSAVPLSVPLVILVAATGRSARPRIGWLAFPGISLAVTAVALPMRNGHEVHAYTLILLLRHRARKGIAIP